MSDSSQPRSTRDTAEFPVRGQLDPPGFQTAGGLPAMVLTVRGGRGFRPNPPPIVTPTARGFDLPALLRALWRQLHLAVALGVLVAAASTALVYAVLPPVRYPATVLFRIAPTQPRVIFETTDLVDDSRGEFKRYQDTQEVLVKSTMVLTAALRAREVATLALIRTSDDPREYLEKRLTVEFEGMILKIMMSSEDPKASATIANAVATAYLNEIVNVEQKQRIDRQEMLKRSYSEYQERLKYRRQSQRALAESTGSSDVEGLSLKQQSALARLSELERELLQVQSGLRRIEVQTEVLGLSPQPDPRQASPKPSTAAGLGAAAEERVRRDPDVIMLSSRIDQLERSLQRNTRIARQRHDPSMRESRLELAALRKDLQRRIESLSSEQPAKTPSPSTTEPNNAILEQQPLSAQLDYWRRYEARVKDEIARLSDSTKALGQRSLELEQIREEITQSEATAKKIGEELERLSVELQAPARVQLIQRAEPPRAGNSWKRIAVTGATGVGCFGLVLLGIGGWEYGKRKISVPTEVEGLTGVKYLGGFPAPPLVKSRRAKSTEQSLEFQRQLAHWSDLLRAGLIQTMMVNDAQLLLVSSARRGEGKTTVALQLASSLARDGRKTLLIDANPALPRLHEHFALSVSPGFSEVLEGEVCVPDAIQPTLQSNLWLMAAGHGGGDTIAHAGHRLLDHAFGETRARFEMIIVDSPPLLASPETCLLAPHSDGVVLSMLCETSRVPDVQVACERIHRVGSRALGAILLGVPEHLLYQTTSAPRSMPGNSLEYQDNT